MEKPEQKLSMPLIRAVKINSKLHHVYVGLTCFGRHQSRSSVFMMMKERKKETDGFPRKSRLICLNEGRKKLVAEIKKVDFVQPQTSLFLKWAENFFPFWNVRKRRRNFLYAQSRKSFRFSSTFDWVFSCTKRKERSDFRINFLLPFFG